MDLHPIGIHAPHNDLPIVIRRGQEGAIPAVGSGAQLEIRSRSSGAMRRQTESSGGTARLQAMLPTC